MRVLRNFTIFFLFTALSLFRQISASAGDLHPVYVSCVNRCIENKCHGNPSDTSKLPLDLKLFRWDCGSNCGYECEITAENYFAAHNLPSQQYHGKWYFIRVFGIQELFSVFFSMLNFMIHYNGYHIMRRCIPDEHPAKRLCLSWAIVGMNAWVWSSVFHIRDTPITEKLDYFSAGAFVLFGSYCTLILMLRLDQLPGGKLLCWIIGVIFIAAFIAHVSYLSFYSFDYGYNMKANVAVGLVQNILWYYYSWSNRNSGLYWTRWPAYIVTSLMLATSLELFDFSPIANLIDAHALWHLSTVPITHYLYGFVVRKCSYDLTKGTFKIKAYDSSR
ncbi:GPI-phospholipase A2 activity regulator Pga3 [Schizosaccharomyces pombe]|uniref:Protein PER1 homolog n=1 Tax=Schizosaccharomyces pombe (strain 972 / ATCC 24843) TaxID=284812 RepID=PER1_SCHPO|nr:putative GPI-phospholipase A2 activity regulator [Schizosaccharomyces pombe]Q9P6N9.1 RecName: Full=Protein PER1 homolog; Flags: Precursor [Schizosaccharomyces pombe 972h-]CAB90152.1 GPI-phospholipase A2 activity regulator (predicted) [Schizosaccharomyces pombe]|eukprot:NP_593834.1 putative GPI-phospholipase A2 activity regulator [Schizosaccharomyces pombe]